MTQYPALHIKALQIIITGNNNQRTFDETVRLMDNDELECAFVLGELSGAELISVADGNLSARLYPIIKQGNLSSTLASALHSVVHNGSIAVCEFEPRDAIAIGELKALGFIKVDKGRIFKTENWLEKILIPERS